MGVRDSASYRRLRIVLVQERDMSPVALRLE